MGLKSAAIDTILGDGARDLKRRWHKAGRRGRRKLLFFHQVDDAHSHLLAEHIPRLLAAYDFDLDLRVVPPPGPTADPEPALRRAYVRHDAALLARYYDLNLPLATPAPQATVDDANRAVLAEPTIERAIEVGRKLLGGAPIDAPQVNLQQLSDNEALRDRLGHYHSAMLYYEGEWYWGIDRIWHIVERLRAEGVEARSNPLPVERQGPIDESKVVLPATLEMFFSFRSPYSYMALARTFDLADRFDGLTVVVRPVLPMVTRGLPVPFKKRFYIVQDAKRECVKLGLPFGRIADPLGRGVERCLAMFYLADARGRGREFLLSAATGIWSEGLEVSTDAGMQVAIERAGLDWSELRAAEGQAPWRDAAENNRKAMVAHGLWGVPSFSLGSFTTWGQDRIWILDSMLQRVC